ncbi:hypothetical protein BH23CHL4_BH23CHL4_02000 [soil metagenome]
MRLRPPLSPNVDPAYVTSDSIWPLSYQGVHALIRDALCGWKAAECRVQGRLPDHGEHFMVILIRAEKSSAAAVLAETHGGCRRAGTRDIARQLRRNRGIGYERLNTSLLTEH